MNTHFCTFEYNGTKRTLKGTFEEIQSLVHFMRHASPLKRDNISDPMPIDRKGEERCLVIRN